MSDFALFCPVCNMTVRQTHHCTATAHKYPPLEGEAAVEAARRVKQALQETRRPQPNKPRPPHQPSMHFGSEGL